MNAFFILTQKTLRDLFRERILYNVIFVGFFLLFFGYLAALLTYGRQDRVMLHFGTFVNAFCLYAVAVSAGARLIRQEIETRSLTLALISPISRTSYYFSKFAGVSVFLFFNMVLLALVLAGGLSLTGGGLSLAFFQSFSLLWMEATYLIALALMLSQFLNPGINSMISLSFLFLSHNHEQIAYLQHADGGNKKFFSFLESLTPDGSLFLLDTRVFYHEPLLLQEWIQRMGYGLLWGLFFLLIGNAFFYRKNI
jgi:hypothetical protein